MAGLSNFDSVIQLAFGINSLLYVYTSRPHLQKRIEYMLNKYEEELKAYRERLKRMGTKPVEPSNKEQMWLSAPYRVHSWDKGLHAITSLIAGFLTIASLAVLIFSGFNRNLEVSNTLMLCLLGLLLVPTPAMTFLQYMVYKRIITKELDELWATEGFLPRGSKYF